MHIDIQFDERKIDRIFAELDQSHLPGAAVGISLHGRPIYRKGFGLASMELPVVLSPSIRLRIGSTTKQFVCLAYLLLCEEGLAAVDDVIGKFLPELPRNIGSVSLRQLMGNVSGLRDVYEAFYLFNEPYDRLNGPAQSVTSADLLRYYEKIPGHNASPGTQWIYNNGGWLLLSAAIERITGTCLEEVLAKRIFQPLGMQDTLLRRLDSDYVTNTGSQHVVRPGGGFEKIYWGVENFIGAGAMASTVDDLLRWLAHMNEPWVGTEATWRMMRTAQTLANGTSVGYGFGLILDRYRGVDTVHHAGGAYGGNAHILKVPAAGLDVAVIVNRQDYSAAEFINRILDACISTLDPFGNPFPGPLARGVFQCPETGRIIQLVDREGRQFVVLNGGEVPAEVDDAGNIQLQFVWSTSNQSVSLVGERQAPSAIRFH